MGFAPLVIARVSDTPRCPCARSARLNAMIVAYSKPAALPAFCTALHPNLWVGLAKDFDFFRGNFPSLARHRDSKSLKILTIHYQLGWAPHR